MISEFIYEGSICFLLKNETLSLMLRIRDGQPELLHFGAPVSEGDASAFSVKPGPGWGDSLLLNPSDTSSCQDSLPLAFSARGNGDFRDTALILHDATGPVQRIFNFSGSTIFEYGEIPEFPLISALPLPSAHGDRETLVLFFEAEGLELQLYFSLFSSALVRKSILVNKSISGLHVERLMSSLVDLKGRFELSTFDGGWISETHEHRSEVGYAMTLNCSGTGFSSNRHNSGVLLSRKGATENSGEVYAFNIIYSGNHYTSAQLSAQGFTRILQGINPESFCRPLEPGDAFETPEAIITYSGAGFNGASHNMHDFILHSVVPEYWSDKERPVLFNSWEGCMFDFNESKLLSMAREAKNLGCELFVLDDGWFGSRDSDTSGLGDYSINRRKLRSGLDGLSAKLGKIGIDFGLWFEPEAVNPDSELYRAHPDWAIHIPGCRDIYGRNELLLDLRRKDVRDYICENVSEIIDRAGLKYVKWDMNRHSLLTGSDAHDYILGLYDVLRRIFVPRPRVLLESCSSGGNRFDPGMLCFSPQIWASDDTDPVERLDIQGGLYRLYPQSCIGAHISAAPHAQTLRQTPLSTRANAAFFGAFGIELDPALLLPVEKEELKAAISFYKEHRHNFQFGRLSRINSDGGTFALAVFDGENAIAGLFQRLVHAAPGCEWLNVPGFEPNCRLRISSRPQNLRVASFGGLLKHVLPVAVNPNGPVVRTADRHYKMADGEFSLECSGAALTSGVLLNNRFCGTGYEQRFRNQGDFGSNVYLIEKIFF